MDFFLPLSNEIFKDMTPEEIARYRREQAISLAFASIALHGQAPRPSREALGRKYDERQFRRRLGLEP